MSVKINNYKSNPTLLTDKCFCLLCEIKIQFIKNNKFPMSISKLHEYTHNIQMKDNKLTGYINLCILFQIFKQYKVLCKMSLPKNMYQVCNSSGIELMSIQKYTLLPEQNTLQT